ncbi:MAG TPA: MATE family efflux transporter [Xanthobacteraceae bacterium]|jgi:putative MATE family efflux protein|nr:MATE family efflux transporter [Xanthobacteraceae bacterium]
MDERTAADSRTTISSTVTTAPVAARPVAARTKLLLEGPILPTLLRLSAPNILNLLAIAGMITFDGLFVGRLGPDVLAGVSLAFPFVMLIQHTSASGMGGGVSSAIARALGANKRDVADALAFHAFVLALSLATIFSTGLLLGAPFIFQWMGGHGDMLSAAFAYGNVAFGGAVSICMLNLLGSVVRGTGNMGLPACAIVGSVAAHVLISPVLIFGWGPVPALGPAGAGWGLIIPFGAGSFLLFFYLRSSRSLVTLPFRGVRPQWRLFAEILKVGGPGLINVTITNISVVLLTGIAGHIGQETAVGYAMGARLEYILIPLAFGFGTSIVAMVGTNWGAKQYRRAYQIAWTGAVTVGATCAFIGLIVALRPSLWMGLFTEDERIVNVGASYLQIVGPIYGLYGTGMALYFASQGLGNVIWTVVANAVRLLISIGGGLMTIYWFGLSATGFFAAIAAAFCAYAMLTSAAILSVKEPKALEI